MNSNAEGLNNLDFQTIINNENGRNYFDLTEEISNYTKTQWNNFKAKRILDKAATFCNLFSIDIESASLWTDTKLTSITLDLTESKAKPLNTKIKTGTKAWWKFW